MEKKHGNTGRTPAAGHRNAAHGEENLESFLHIRCSKADKARWVKAAQKDGKKLAAWVVDRLNSE